MDNLGGDCFVEQFPTKRQCMLYLAGLDLDLIMDEKKYRPETKDELKMLCDNPDVFLGDIDTSRITDMESLFHYSSRYDFSGIEYWDTSNVCSMRNMFTGSHIDNDIRHWDVSKVEDMSNMFAHSDFDGFLNDWDVSHVKYMCGMFYGCPFNQDIGSWDVSNVINMNGMFMDDRQFNRDISVWDVSNVTTMNAMFYGANRFNQDISGWNLSSLRSACNMFSKAQDLHPNLLKMEFPESCDISICFFDSNLDALARKTDRFGFALTKSEAEEDILSILDSSGCSNAQKLKILRSVEKMLRQRDESR